MSWSPRIDALRLPELMVNLPCELQWRYLFDDEFALTRSPRCYHHWLHYDCSLHLCILASGLGAVFRIGAVDWTGDVLGNCD